VTSLLRYSHIFASVVRDILETKLLKKASPLPLSLSQFHLLKLMSINGVHQIGEVAGFLGVSAPAATRNIDKLEGLGLMSREPSKDDRRATCLSVSQKGRRIVRRYEELKTERLEPVLDNFTEHELETLSELLERFSVSLIEMEKIDSGACLRCAAYVQKDCPVGHVRGGCPYQKGRRPATEGEEVSDTS
jgi:DNA-binding MarR family transcriptional regulator